MNTDAPAEECVIPAPGIYDPREQLAPDEVVELKQQLADKSLAAMVCAQVVVDMRLDSEASLPRRMRMSKKDFGWVVGNGAVSWFMFLQEALGLPGDQWPEGSPPATFAVALQELQEERGIGIPKEQHG